MKRKIVITIMAICILFGTIILSACNMQKRNVHADEMEDVIVRHKTYEKNPKTQKYEKVENSVLRNFKLYAKVTTNQHPTSERMVYGAGEFTFYRNREFLETTHLDNSYVAGHVSFVKLYHYGTLVHNFEGKNEGEILFKKEIKKSGRYTLQIGIKFIDTHNWETMEYIVTHQFAIDNTPPTLKITTLKGVEVKNGSYVSELVKIWVDDTYLKEIVVSRNGKVIRRGMIGSVDCREEGDYEIYAIDLLKNKTETVRFRSDNTKPKVKIKVNGVETDKHYANGVLSLDAEDNIGIDSILYWTDENDVKKKYEKGIIETPAKSTKIYVQAIDKAGNKSDVKEITIDKTTPQIKTYADGREFNGEHTKATNITFETIEDVGILETVIKRNGYKFAGLLRNIEENGVYEIYVVDLAGNKSETRTVTLDNEKPKINVLGEKQPKDGILRANADVIFEAIDNLDQSPKVFIKKDSGEFKQITQRAIIEDGEYELYTEDKCGNRSEILRIKRNTKKPTAKLMVDGELFRGEYSKSTDIRFVSNESTQKYISANGHPWTHYSDGMFLAEGEYKFKAVDDVGNESLEKRICVDRHGIEILTKEIVTAPFAVETENTNSTSPLSKITVNGREYNGEIINPIYGGVYDVKTLDKAGNICTKIIKSVYEGYIDFSPIDQTFDTPNDKGQPVSFSTYNKAKEYALKREWSDVEKVRYSPKHLELYKVAEGDTSTLNGDFIYIYKSAKNRREKAIYFSKTLLSEVLLQNAEKSIQKVMYFDKKGYLFGDENVHQKEKVYIKNTLKTDNRYRYFLNDKEIERIEDEGEQTIDIVDRFGQKRSYTFVVLKRPPIVAVKVGASIVSVDTKKYFSSDVDFVMEPNSHLNIYDAEFNLIRTYSSLESAKLTNSGEYYVEAINRYGRNKKFEIVLSRQEPGVEFFENEITQKLEITIIEQQGVPMLNIAIYRMADGKKERMWQDSDAKDINTDSHRYTFNRSGEYAVEVSDKAHLVSKEHRHKYSKPEPRYSANTDKSKFAGNFVLNYQGDAKATITTGVNTTEYLSGTKIEKDGMYLVKLYNSDGFLKEFKFEIDNTPPEIIGEYEKIGNRDVTIKVKNADTVSVNNERVRHTEITFNKTGKYTIKATDEVGNSSETSFEIDKDVDISGIENGGIYNSVEIVPKEKLTMRLTFGGKTVPSEGKLINAGNYVLVANDRYGNIKTIRFQIVPKISREISHDFEDLQATVNGDVTKGKTVFNKSGKYLIAFHNSKCEFEIINQKPQIKIIGIQNGKGYKASIDTEKTVKTVLKYNGKTIKYFSGIICDKVGKYEVTAIDNLGNTNTASFEIIKKKAKAGIIIPIVIAIAVATGVGIFFVVKKKKKNKKEKKK